MALTTASVNEAFLPEEIGRLVVQPVLAESVATRVATVEHTSAHVFHLPTVTADPAAAWVAEGAEIPPSDAVFAETAVTFSKLAGLTIISRELAEDSSPAAAKVVGDGIARDIARKLDQAFFGSVAAPAPDGLEDLVGVGTVAAGASYTNLDPFLTAVANAETVGAPVSAFVTSPATALTLAKIRTGTGSNQTLLQAGGDPTKPTQRLIAGVPVYVSPAVTAGVVWAIPADRVFVVLRADTRLEVDRSVYFTSDRVAVKASMRVGFGFAHAAAVIKISTT